jgi:ribosomal protein S18 acetylase RimI-like enzyme
MHYSLRFTNAVYFKAMRSETGFTIRPVEAGDREWIVQQLTEQWGAPLVVRQGESIQADQLPGWIAEVEGERAGLVTYLLRGKDCEIATLHSLVEGRGIGSALIETARRLAVEHDCRRLWVITTNDNLPALGFYQKRGFSLVKVYPGMVDASRKVKPQIPLVGMHGIPIRDEIELELRLDP